MYINAIIPAQQLLNPSSIAWAITLFLVLLALKYGRGAIEGFLMKMYESFIQRNPVKL